MKIHQFVHTLAYGDAISNEALQLRRALQKQGIGSEIFVVHAHEKLKAQTRPYQTLGELPRDEKTVFILHYSIASPLNEIFNDLQDCLRVLIYHNITPETWFLAYNARVVGDLRSARAGLAKAVNSADLVLADSAYNLSELSTDKPSAVFPLVLDEDKWNIAANAGIAGLLSSGGRANFLHVGRTAPNKCLEDILKIFYFFHHKIDKQSRLWLVGSDIDTEIYSFELRRLALELHIEEAVTFAGSVADCELRSFYENSDIYLCMSEHEGFCVPLLEAMHFGVPILAYAQPAVKETLSGAGIIFGEKRHAEIAEAAQLVLADNSLREKCVRAGRERLQEFGWTRFEERLAKHLIHPAQEWAGGA